ncbi:MAG: hypothetical protein KIT14_15825 [bacterium]|nr:hypothetical protein [bacterium]
MRSLAAVLAAVILVACGGEPSTPTGRPGLQDHGPHHGGVVFAGPRVVLETTAQPDGRVRVWITDEWRQPVSLQDLHGSVTFVGAPESPTVPLAVRGEVLEAQGPTLTGDTIGLEIAVDRPGQTLRLPVVVPLRAGAPGAATVSVRGCLPPEPGEGTLPRCVLPFLQAVGPIATPRDGRVVVVAALESPTTVWRLPEGTLAASMAAPPPVDLGPGHAPHVEEPVAMAIAPDGRDVVLAIGEHLFRHDLATGRLVRELAAPGPPLRHVAWSTDGTSLVATLLASGTVHVLDATDGTPRRTVEIDGEATALAASPSADVAAVGTEEGTLVLVSLGDGATRTLGEAGERIEAVAFAGERIVTASADGVLRVWDAARGEPEARVDVGTPLLRLAVTADGRRAATADRTGRIRLHTLPDGRIVDTLGWHDGQVRGLAWAGAVLVSADADRRLALWDLPASSAPASATADAASRAMAPGTFR